MINFHSKNIHSFANSQDRAFEDRPNTALNPYEGVVLTRNRNSSQEDRKKGHTRFSTSLRSFPVSAAQLSPKIRKKTYSVV